MAMAMATATATHSVSKFYFYFFRLADHGIRGIETIICTSCMWRQVAVAKVAKLAELRAFRMREMLPQKFAKFIK